MVEGHGPNETQQPLFIKERCQTVCRQIGLNDKSEMDVLGLLSILIVRRSFLFSSQRENFRNINLKEQTMLNNKRLFTSESVTEGHPI